METQSTPALTHKDVELLMENALLKNNEHQMKEIRAEIESSAEKITRAVSDTTSPLLKELISMNTRITEHAGEIETLKQRITGLWAKVIAVGTACATVGAFLGVILEYLITSVRP